MGVFIVFMFCIFCNFFMVMRRMGVNFVIVVRVIGFGFEDVVMEFIFENVVMEVGF